MDLLNRYYQAYINALQNSQNQQPSPFNGMYGGGSVSAAPSITEQPIITQPQEIIPYNPQMLYQPNVNNNILNYLIRPQGMRY